MDIQISNKFKDRLLGNCFKDNIKSILCFPKCNSIHTFFMKVSIDVIMLDKNKRVIYIFNNIKPWRIILPKKKVYYTLEYPINTHKYKIKDLIEF